MSDNDKRITQPRVEISIVQKFGIFFLMPAFIVAAGLIIYDKKLADPVIIAATGLIVFVVFLVAIYLIIRKLVKEQYKAYKKLELMSITDELTQLFTKKHFDYLFENEMARARRYDRYLCCAVMEIDDFEKIQQEYGSQFSDEILQDTAETIKDDLRITDMLAHDDDKFFCLLPETDIGPALYVSKRIRAVVEGITFDFEKNDQPVNITISIGITSSNPCQDKEIDIHGIIATANNALITAKEKGGNRIEHLTTDDSDSLDISNSFDISNNANPA